MSKRTDHPLTKRDIKKRRINPCPELFSDIDGKKSNAGGASGSTAVGSNDKEGDGYFSSYSDLSIHELMLRDHPRNQAYHDAILANREFIKDKVCMDVGCGSGFLAMLLVKVGGAKHVHAIEGSAGIAIVAEALIERNGMEDQITVHQKRVEDLTVEELVFADVESGNEKDGGDLKAVDTEKNDQIIGRKEENIPTDKPIDAIVSEWMGFYLFHESMLDSVIFARDQFLKDDGLMLPSSCTLYAAPIDCGGMKKLMSGGELKSNATVEPDEKTTPKENSTSKENSTKDDFESYRFYFRPDRFYGFEGFNEFFGKTGKFHLEQQRIDDLLGNHLIRNRSCEYYDILATNPNIELCIVPKNGLEILSSSKSIETVTRLVSSTTTTSGSSASGSGGVTASGSSASSSSKVEDKATEPHLGGQIVIKLDIHDRKNCTIETLADIQTAKNLKFTTKRDGLFGAIGFWFDCGFDVRTGLQKTGEVVLSTAPDAPPTHWRQTLVWLQGGEGPIFAPIGKNEEVQLAVHLQQSPENKRHYEIGLELC